MTQERPSVTVVVPVYNSEGTLRDLVARLEPVLLGTAERFEVILLNDGSRDRSWEVISELAVTYPWVRGVCMMRNYGQHNAVLCGVRLARYDVTVTMDDDLQHPPEEVPKLVAKLGEGYDVVYGTPLKMEHSISRNLLSRVTKLGMSMAVGERVIVEINAFRALRTSLRQSFDGFQAPNLLFDAILGWGTTRFTSIRVQHSPRTIGQSNYTPARLLNQILLLITGYSTGPLRLGSIVGFAFTLLGVALLVYVVVVRLTLGSPLGFAFQMAVMAIFGGAQLFILGIMGEYLARMFNRTMDRPTYTIRDIVGTDAGRDR
jgi:undecaprenyl-phosphate 4-deoxy-4-formamido-L-arabinose transferase